MKKENNKKEVLMEAHTFLSKYDFEGDINKVAEMIKTIPERLIEHYPHNLDFKKAHRFSIRADTETDYGSDDRQDIYIVQAYRWETNTEFQERIELNKKKSAAARLGAKTKQIAKEKREKTLYENLKKKFANR